MKKITVSGPKQEGKKWSPTELLIVALISHGHAPTLYALQRETLLSAGALVPALAKLKAKGLLHADETGPRNRKQFRVPAGVLSRVAEEWKASAQAHIADCDAVLKLCKAAEIFDLPEAVEYAHAGAEFRTAELRKYTSRTGHIEAPDVDPRSFRSYKDVARFHQLQAEQLTLTALEKALRTEMLGTEAAQDFRPTIEAGQEYRKHSRQKSEPHNIVRETHRQEYGLKQKRGRNRRQG